MCHSNSKVYFIILVLFNFYTVRVVMSYTGTCLSFVMGDKSAKYKTTIIYEVASMLSNFLIIVLIRPFLGRFFVHAKQPDQIR